MPITASEGSARFAAAKPELDDLIKRRFFFRQAFEIYGGVGGFFTYGPPGAAVKQNLMSERVNVRAGACALLSACVRGGQRGVGERPF